MGKLRRAFFCSIGHWAAGIMIILVCGGWLWGLDPDKDIAEYLVNQWDAASGIPSNTILSMAQTPDGYLWIATAKGLVRFDGIRFSSVDFTANLPLTPGKTPIPEMLYTDSDGTLWIGSAVGLTSFQYRSGQFKTFTSANGLTKDSIRRIKGDSRGNLWISFWAGNVNRYSNGSFTRFTAAQGLQDKKVNIIIEDQNGNVLFGTREHGVFVYREDRFSRFPVPGLENPTIIAMHEDEKGELWIGTTNGLFRVNRTGTRKYTTADGLSHDYITAITEDSDQNLWVGTLKGLNCLKKDRATPFLAAPQLGHLIIVCILEDSEKTLWVGTYDTGIKHLKVGKFSSYRALDKFPAENILSIYEDYRGDTWAGSLSGKLFHCRENDLVEVIQLPTGLGITAITGDAQGNLWLGTNRKGIFKKENNTLIPLKDPGGLIGSQVNSLFLDSNHYLWAGTFTGVSIIRTPYNGEGSEPVIESFTSRQGLLGKVVYNFYEDKNKNIRIAADKGVTVLKNGKTAKENQVHYLQDTAVTCIYEDTSTTGSSGTGVSWLATHGAGLKRFQDGNITSYTTAEGMTTNFLYQFFADQEENFWFMSDSGVLRVSKQDLNRYARGEITAIHCTSFGTSAGLKSQEFNNEFSRHSALKTRTGEFRFITKQGIAVVNPAKIGIEKTPPPVVLEAVYFNREAIAFRQEKEAFKGVTDIRFRFTAPTFLSPEKISFKFQLAGYEKKWNFLPPGSERVAQYKNLKPGTYTFRVSAGSAAGVWNPTGASFTFTLEPYFYETLVFKLVVVLLLMAAAAAGFYFYKRQLLVKQAKYKGSPMNPQFAGECIKKLNHLMEVEKLYREADLSLQFLADKLSVSTHILSQILNEKLKRNFSDFINYYRIEEAKEMLRSSKGADQKIITVAFDVGFNTKVAFYNAFKKYTNMTPSQYKKKAETQTD